MKVRDRIPPIPQPTQLQSVAKTNRRGASETILKPSRNAALDLNSLRTSVATVAIFFHVGSGPPSPHWRFRLCDIFTGKPAPQWRWKPARLFPVLFPFHLVVISFHSEWNKNFYEIFPRATLQWSKWRLTDQKVGILSESIYFFNKCQFESMFFIQQVFWMHALAFVACFCT